MIYVVETERRSADTPPDDFEVDIVCSTPEDINKLNGPQVRFAALAALAFSDTSDKRFQSATLCDDGLPLHARASMIGRILCGEGDTNTGWLQHYLVPEYDRIRPKLFEQGLEKSFEALEPFENCEDYSWLNKAGVHSNYKDGRLEPLIDSPDLVLGKDTNPEAVLARALGATYCFFQYELVWPPDGTDGTPQIASNRTHYLVGRKESDGTFMPITTILNSTHPAKQGAAPIWPE